MNLCGAVLPDQVSPFLKVYVTDLANGDFVVGYLGDGASGSITSNWASPFAGASLASIAGQVISGGGGMLEGAKGAVKQAIGGAASKIGDFVSNNAQMGNDLASLFFGDAGGAVINSAMVWQGQEPPQFTLPIDFIARSNAYLEVQSPIRVLQQMASPELKAVMPGGRIPARVTLDIGRRIKLVNVIIQEVTYELDAPRNIDGYFIRNRVSIQCCGQVSYNRSDFNSMFI